MSAKSNRFCGQCGESTDAKDRFCTGCGFELARSAQARKSTNLPPPTIVQEEESDVEYYGGMAWVDHKGSFVVPDVPPPQPMSFVEAVKHGFRNSFNFRGRASRSEYWYLVLLYPFAALSMIFVFAILGLLSSEQGTEEGSTALALLPLATLAMVLPVLSAGVRRLHDTGRSAKWLLINIIPFGGLVIFFFLCERGDDVPNRFGPP